jgi:hypothetical protein
MKITRRKLAAVALAPAAMAFRPAVAFAQTPAAEEDLDALVRSQLRGNSDTLAKAGLSMETEPAFHFKA